MTPIIEARDVRKTYRLGRVDVPVLRGASLSVEPGECVGVLGASGSGKSTLLHILGALDRPDRRGPGGGAGGEVLFEGEPLASRDARSLNRYRNRSVGFVFQFYHLLPEMSVLENAMVGALVGLGRLGHLRAGASLRARASEILDRFGLAERLRHRPAELSGGERQRVAIARALMNEPKLLLADEPTGNLDEKTGSSILDAIMDLRADRGLTLVMVTHDAKVASRADRVVRLADGAVAEEGAPAVSAPAP